MIRLIAILLVALLLLSSTGCSALYFIMPGISGSCALNDGIFPKPEPDYNAKRLRDLSPFADALASFSSERAAQLDEALASKTILDIQDMLANGDLSSAELVTYYIDRIQRYDIDRLNAVMELNPEALAIAQALDEERAAGSLRGAMHGIPVLLKDNIATGDGLHAAAGAVALADWQPQRDAFLVQQLRESGAVILGKANLSEWANWMDSCLPNGFSALGGQTQNPHGPYDPLGSSSGSAVAAAANLVTVSVGSETQGSIIAPAENNSVVALKTSLGLVSRDHIIPLLPFQDVPGPIGRNVTDIAILLTAMTGTDENDPATANAAPLSGTDFTQFLDPQAAAGLKVGISLNNSSETESAQARAITAALSAAGVDIVDIPTADVPRQGDVRPLLTHGYKLAINEFLAGLGDQVAVSSLADIVAFNNDDLANRAPHGQDHLEASLASAMSAAEYAAARDALVQPAQERLDALFTLYEIDVLVNNRTQAYAQAGYPALTIPAGVNAGGQPLGITLIGSYLGEPALIGVAYIIEQATQARVEPDLNAAIQLIDALPELE